MKQEEIEKLGHARNRYETRKSQTYNGLEVDKLISQSNSHLLAEVKEKDDLLYMAWTIIANANEGNWDNAIPEWKQAAEKWRDDWHKLSNKPTYEYDILTEMEK